jgi:hypothetical protein
MNRKFPLVAFVTLFLASPTGAEESDILSGSFFFDREDNACPKLGTCTISFQIDGAAAMEIYNKMRVKAVADECTGGLVKEDGQGMRCYKEDSGFSCDFGYSFEKKKFGDSLVTC